MKHLFSTIAMAFAAMLLTASCTQDSPITDPRQAEPDTIQRGTFAKGADVSWLTQLESEGYTFSNKSGVATECMQLLRDDCGVDAIRLRVWVNPTDGWNNIQDVLVKARRAQSLGLRLMIDFHFSDTWADPASQTVPAAWADYDLAQLKTAVSQHVSEMLTLLREFGIEPEWVQIGNETRLGMLWPVGQITNGTAYAELTNAGYDAVKAVFPDCKVIVHLDGGDNLGLYTYVFDYLKANGGRYDMIGMSLYPDPDTWQTSVAQCVSNISTLYQRYGADVMVCEIGMSYDQAEACRDCIARLMADGKATGHLQGIFYWEPEAPAGYNEGYTKGCFADGQPTVALDAFRSE